MTDPAPLHYESRSKLVSELVHLYQSKRLNLNPGFQRQSVWKRRDRQRLIESVLNRFPIPAIFLYRHEVEGRDIYDVIDGKQRLESIFMFIGEMKGRFDVRVQLPGTDNTEQLSWTDLRKRRMQNRVEGYELPVITVDGQFSEIVQLFVRINSTGMPLTRQEKANATYFQSPFLRKAYALAKKFEPYFKEMGVVSEGQISRMKHVELVCELMLSINKGDALNRKSALDRMMAANGIDGRSLDKASRETATTLKRVKSMFPRLAYTRLRKLADFYSLTVLIAKFEAEGLVLTDKKRNRLAWDLLNAFAFQVDKLREHQRKAETTNFEQSLHREYLLTVLRGTDEINQRRNRERILRSILESIFARKDSQRGFSPEQRRIMWNSAESHRCGECNARLDWTNFTIDHVDPHTKGGRSILENAAILCQPCNSAKGARRRKTRPTKR